MASTHLAYRPGTRGRRSPNRVTPIGGTMRGKHPTKGQCLLLLCVLGAWLAFSSPAWAVSKNVELLSTLPEAKWATAVNFLKYDDRPDVMLVTGRFGLKAYSLENPAEPTPLSEITSEQLELPGDPPTDWTLKPDGDPKSTYW